MESTWSKLEDILVFLANPQVGWIGFFHLGSDCHYKICLSAQVYFSSVLLFTSASCCASFLNAPSSSGAVWTTCTDLLYGHVITKISRMGRLPHFLRYGATLAWIRFKTNRFHVAVGQFSNRSQKTSKYGKNISDALTCGSCATSLFIPHFEVIWYLIGTLRNYDGDGKENVKKAIGLMSKTKTLNVHHAFLHISLLSLQNYDVKWPNFNFIWERDRQGDNFYYLCLNSGEVPSLQLQPKFPSFK